MVKVHPEYLLAQRLPGMETIAQADPAFWEQRYASIRSFEEHVASQGVVVMKFFLHMSRAVQKERFLERIEDPEKNWKFGLGDVKERALWKDYERAYEEAIGATATPHAPWHIVPADEQWESRAIVAALIRERLERMDPQPPSMSDKAKSELEQAREQLGKEGA